MTTMVCPHCDELILCNTDTERFYLYVHKRGPTPDPSKGCIGSCWIWCGSVSAQGYGQFSVAKGNGRMIKPTHRLSWELNRGEIPTQPVRMFVCHKCDNKLCVNPDHLFLGTGSDNILDYIKKGLRRSAKGEGIHTAKLTSELAVAIAIDYANSQDSFVTLGKKYGVGAATIKKCSNW